MLFYLKFKSSTQEMHFKMSTKCQLFCSSLNVLTHWDRVTHICINKLTTIGSDNGLSPGRRQAIILSNTGILLIGPLGTNLSESFIEIHVISFKKMHLNVSSAKWRPFCLGRNVLTEVGAGIFSALAILHRHAACHRQLYHCFTYLCRIDLLRPEQNGQYFVYNILKRNSLKENSFSWIKILLKLSCS